MLYMKKILLSLIMTILLSVNFFALNYQDLFDKYNITINFENKTDTWNMTTYEKLSESESEHFVTLVSKAFENYTKDVFEKISLKHIVLVKKLKFNNIMRAAVPDNYQKTLFLSINDSYADFYIVHYIIHEINHYIEYYFWNDYRYKWLIYEKL